MRSPEGNVVDVFTFQEHYFIKDEGSQLDET